MRYRELAPGFRAVVGLTGSIASGKSHARELLARLGAVTVDADALGHAAYARGTACFAAVVAEFGPGIVGADGEVDRRVLGPLVFGAPDRLRALNAIVWPAIELGIVQALRSEAAAEAAPGGSPAAAAPRTRVGGGLVAVIEAAVLLEAGWGDKVDAVWVTWAPDETVVARLAARNGLSVEAARARLAAQMPLGDRLARADVAVDTSGAKDQTQVALTTHWTALLQQLDAGGGLAGGAAHAAAMEQHA